VFQPILPLHECADPAATEYGAAESTTKPLYSIADSVAAKSAAKPLQSVADSTTGGAAPTERS
jgi:hypothetical protein